MNMLKAFAVIGSPYIDMKQIWVNPLPQDIPPESEEQKVRHEEIINVPITDRRAIIIVKYIIEDNIPECQAYLKQIRDEFYVDCLVIIQYNGAKNHLEDYTKVSKSGRRVQTLPQDKLGFIKPETFIKRYELAGKPKNLPYINYDKNDTGEQNCVYEYVMKTYGEGSKGISKKAIDKHFKKDTVVIDDICNFCDEYKIKMQLWNIDHVLLTNSYFDDKKYVNKNRKAFIGMITNHHLYPAIKDDQAHLTATKPKLNENIILDVKDTILYVKNNNITITKEEVKKNNDEEIENAFFKNITPNFSYEAERSCKIKSLNYVDPRIEKGEYEEYDINKAYYTMAHDIIKGSDKFPVFTASSIWETYKHNYKLDICNVDYPTVILDNNIIDHDYYLIAIDAMARLKTKGFISNLLMGHCIKLLLNNGDLCFCEIEHVKHATYTVEWSAIQRRIEELKTKQNIKDKYIFYNGILGIVNKKNSIGYTGLIDDDIKLLNYDQRTQEFRDDWFGNAMPTNALNNDENERMEYIAQKITHSFKHINTINVYNYVISRCNVFLLEVMYDIIKREKVELIKIKVDSLVFNKPIKIDDKYSKYFKIVPNDKIYKKHIAFSQSYIDGFELRMSIYEELKCFDTNVCFNGAPGTGKTYKVKGEYKYDVATTTTNLCLLNLMKEETTTKTLYSLLNMWDPAMIHKAYTKLYGKTIWIDEYSMIPAYMWGFIYVLANKYKCKFIITGDINQIGPINEADLNMDLHFYQFVFDKVATLETEWRNDKDIIALRDSVKEEDPENISKIFNYLYDKDSNGFLKYKRHIAYTHQTKNIINYLMIKENNLTYRWTNKPYTDEEGKTKYTSTLDVSNGVILACRKSVKSQKIYKNDIWEVVGKLKDGYKLKSLLRDTIKDEPMKNMCAYELGYCTTAHSSQGLTIPDDMCIHEISKMIWNNKKILYTAITRSRDFDKLHFYKKALTYSDYGMTEANYWLTMTAPWGKIQETDDDIEFQKYDKMTAV